MRRQALIDLRQYLLDLMDAYRNHTGNVPTQLIFAYDEINELIEATKQGVVK